MSIYLSMNTTGYQEYIYIYIYVWDIYNVLQYGITMLYMEYYMERPLTMDIGIDTHETMGYL